jgi:ubiquinone/menaquinone biosynthesis C-methylase UbiE
MFEDKDRLGTDRRNVDSFDKLRLHEDYENWMELPFSRAIDHTNKMISVYFTINKVRRKEDIDRVFVVEVGGGYGRSAIFMLNYFGPRICYVNIDAVPTSLIISEQFIRHNCRSDLVIGGYSDVAKCINSDTGLDLEKYNYLSFPAWHVNILPDNRFDVAMNIWSMQEMSVAHEMLYYELWNRVCRENATLFFLNVNKRNFQRGYHFPDEWIFLYEGKEATYGNPERIFILNPSAGMAMLKKDTKPRRLASLFSKGRKPLVRDNFHDVVALLTGVV